MEWTRDEPELLRVFHDSDEATFDEQTTNHFGLSSERMLFADLL